MAEALAADPEGVHVLARAVRRDVLESVDAFVRIRPWTRMVPGTEPPERHLERQLTLLHQEVEELATALREAETHAAADPHPLSGGPGAERVVPVPPHGPHRSQWRGFDQARTRTVADAVDPACRASPA